MFLTHSCVQYLAYIGKMRFQEDKRAEATIPLLLSIKCFTRISQDFPRSGDFNIFSRWFFLSSVYRSESLAGEGMLVAASALFQSIELPTQGEDPSNDPILDLFHYFGNLANKVMPLFTTSESCVPNERKTLISRLIQLSDGDFESNFSPSESGKVYMLTTSLTIDMLLETARKEGHIIGAFEKHCGLPFSLETILRAVFSNSFSKNESIDMQSLLIMKIKILTDILVEMGRVLQSNASKRKLSQSRWIASYNEIVRLAMSFIRKLHSDSDSACNDCLVATFYVVSSVSLLSRHPDATFGNWALRSLRNVDDDQKEVDPVISMADYLARKAAAALSQEAGGYSQWHVAALAIRPAVNLYCLQLSSLCRYNEVGEPHENVLFQLHTTVKALGDQTCLPSKLEASLQYCVVSTLSRLCDFLSLNGEKLLATQIASLNEEASRLPDRDVHDWFEAITLSLMAADTVAASVASKEIFESRPYQELVDAEIIGCRLRLSASRSMEQAKSNEVFEQLTNLLKVVDEIPSINTNSGMKQLVQWVRTTILLGLAESACWRGDSFSELGYLKACFSECRQLVLASGKDKPRVLVDKTSGGPNFWQEVALGTLLVRCAERKIDCLRRSSLLYSQVGDHRKAASYAISAAKLAGLESLSSTGVKPKISDFLSFFQSRTCKNSRETSFRRLILRTVAQANPLDRTRAAFQGDRGEQIMLPSAKFPRFLAGLSVSKELEEISDVIEGEFKIFFVDLIFKTDFLILVSIYHSW